MFRSELLLKMRDLHPNILSKDMEKIFEIIFIEFTNAFCRNENVEIRGFGTYKIAKRKARTGRNPKNAQLVQIPEKKAIKWKMSKTLFDRLNNNFTGNKISDTY